MTTSTPALTRTAVNLTDTRALRTALALAPTPLTTAGAIVDGSPAGMIIGSFVGHSLEPALVSVSIQKTSTTWPRLRRAPLIGLSILSEANRDAVANFSRPSAERFDGLEYETDGSAILLPGAAFNATARLVEEIEVGDHILAIAQIERAHITATEDGEGHRPLVFHRSAVTTTI
ncbi:flavin reductase family protein [Corynebacterium auris]|uniref:flavin reductase family protein n=1 Tax=Corynebacterium auris TaxID=44750 RepID=UPI0025B2A9DB|nr:flavin reductase family protein [Corynebacterium auris]WJY66958.1 Flavin-dependent monooxygenase, reductase subunit HsaB [Corynebacterium auris]